MCLYFGYEVHKRPKFLTKDTVLFSNENETITVQMLINGLNYILTKIAMQSLPLNVYKTVRKVILACKMLLNNQTPNNFSKADAKLTIEAIEVMMDNSAKSDSDREYNAKMALLCKLIINTWKIS